MHVFISYARGVVLDAFVALQLAEGLRPQHTVFVDPGTVHADWASRILVALQQTEVMIVLLSAAAVQSELVVSEVAQIMQNRTALLLPIRLTYEAPLPYPLNQWLAPYAYLTWQTAKDTEHLLEALQQGMIAGALVGAAMPLPAAPTVVPSTLPSPIPTANTYPDYCKRQQCGYSA